MRHGLDTQGNPVEQALRRQGRVAHQRDQIRRVAGLAVWPSALVGAVLLPHRQGSGGLDAAASWVLLILAFGLLLATSGWWMARQLTPRIPPWPCSRRAARVGAANTLLVASIVAVALWRTAQLAGLIFWTLTVGALVLMGIRERELCRQFEQRGHEILVLVGYR